MPTDPTESTPPTTVAKPNDQYLPPRSAIEEKHISQRHEFPSVPPPTLPPMDKGKHAWLFLTAAFAVEFLTIGQSFSYGRFQSHYTTHAPFASSSSSQSSSSSFAAIIGVLNQSLILIFLPLVLYLARRKPGYARWMATTGLLGCVVSNMASSFCTSTMQLLFTQGVLQGVSGSVAFCPLLVFAEQWFDKRRGLAFGVIGAGGGCGGLILPLLINVLLDQVGYQSTMRVLAGVMFGVGMPLAWFVRPRLPVTNGGTGEKRFWNWKLICSRSFLLHQLANFVQGAGYYLPGIYLPSFTQEVFGASDWLSTASLMLLNVSAMVGLTVMGYMTDRFNSRVCIAVSATGATLSVFLFWGLATHIAVLFIFCILFGLFAGGFPAAWPAVMREMAKKGESRGMGHVDTILIFSLFCLARGVGNIVAGPMSEGLVGGMPWEGEALGGYGSGYGGLVVFCGLSSLVSGMNALWYHLM